MIVNEFMTLDGVVQSPSSPDEDAGGGFEHGGWNPSLPPLRLRAGGHSQFVAKVTARALIHPQTFGGVPVCRQRSHQQEIAGLAVRGFLNQEPSRSQRGVDLGPPMPSQHSA